ncbi:O-antigen ligase like membrane family protein [Acinetobacter baumannii 348935]|nr:O-antigen ligase like membrane family protein [Acinetobacter baumannii 348935]
MIALILFLSTTVFFSIAILVLLIPLVFFRQVLVHKKSIMFSRQEVYAYALMLFAAVIMTYLNIFYDAVIPNIQRGSILGNIPYIILLPIAFLIGKFLTGKDLRIIQYLILIEIVVGCFEYYYGVPTFFVNKTPISELADTDILYQRRVFGFSPNSSNLAAKVIYLAMITLMQIKMNKKICRDSLIFLFFIFVGLFVTFNRTAIIAVVLSFFILFGMSLRGVILVSIPTLGIILSKWDSIYEQMTRGKGTVDLSGRDQIFSYFYNFWSENLLFGNFGTKLWWNSMGNIWHSHNSYLEFFASNGLLLALIFFLGFFMVFSRGLIVVLPILIFSLFQYGFLWGLSFYDIVFSAIIYNYVKQVRVGVSNGV